MQHVPGKALALVMATVGLAVLGAAVAPAGAAAKTLRFFQKSTSSQFLGPDGMPLADPSTIGPGASFQATDVDYAGTHAKHASTFSASDHIACTFTTQTQATCNAQLAIGGSMLLANGVQVTFPTAQNAPIVVPINGGVGAYAHARGTATSVGIGNGNTSDFTIRLR
jgi:hypothetical protein